MRRPGSLVLFCLLFAAPLLANDDLVTLGRVWGIARYTHPSTGYRDVDLDSATLAAIARVRQGARPGAAIGEMLDALRDPATFVTTQCWGTTLPPADRSARVLPGGIAYFAADDAQVATALRDARAAIVDLRSQPGRCVGPALAPELVPLLVRGTVPYARHRKVRHYGYRSQTGTDTSFTSSFTIVDPGQIAGQSATVARVVFITNEHSAIPPVATALNVAGQAAFVSVGRFPLHTAVDYSQMTLSDSSIVTVRASELVDEDGFSAEPSPMIELAADASDADVLAAAEQLARPRSSRRRSSGMITFELPPFAWTPDASFATNGLPPVEQRILAAYRLWNALYYFHGSPDLLGEWDRSLATVIETLDRVSTRAEYELALAGVMAIVPDGVSRVIAPAVATLRGEARPPFELMPVEGKPIVVASAADEVGAGDELLRIDGRDVAERLALLGRYTTDAHAIRDLPRGAIGPARFTFARADGSQYDVTLERETTIAPVAANAWEILDGNVAYVDLAALENVDALFAEVASTRAMILDLRGGTVSADLVSRLSAGGVASLTRVPVLLGGTFNEALVARTVTDSGKPRYAGRTIALIDERTDARTALALRALAGTTLVGTGGAAMHAHVTDVVVPGGIAITFAADELRPVTGVAGLHPDVRVERTRAALASGRDALLDKALSLLD